jgi:nucleotide-binding universal stress UspA family protein
VTNLTTILVGVDGRDGGWEALALARRFARPAGARLVVVCAYPAIAVQHAALVWPHISVPEDAAAVLDAAREHLGADHDAELVSAAGSTPGSVLQRVAGQRGADLIVLGSSRRAELGRVLGGDVVEQTLDHPPCPVAVAPRGEPARAAPLSHVGIAVEGTPESLAAVRWAGALAHAPFEVRTLELIHVDPSAADPAAGDTAIDHLDDKHRFEAFAALRLVGRLSSTVLVTWTEAGGPVASALAKLEPELDLLVVGTRGRGPLGRMLLGGVARAVASSPRCPVVAVPEPPAEAPDDP